MNGMKGCTAVIGGASRGIGYSMAIRMARGGANVVVMARSMGGISYGPGSVEQAVEDVNDAGGVGLGVACDLTKAESVHAAVDELLKTFPTIDVLVNNASSHFEQGTDKLDERRFDSMFKVGPRGTYLLTQEALPHMKAAFNPQVLTIAPASQFHPSYMNFPSVAYAAAKFSMGTIAMGFAVTYPDVSFNILWPQWAIVSHATDTFARKAGVEFAEDGYMMSLVQPSIMADSAYRVVTSANHSTAFTDRGVLTKMGVTDLRPYLIFPDRQQLDDLGKDYFVDAPLCEPPQPPKLPPHNLESLRGGRLLIVGDDAFASALAAAATDAGMRVETVAPFMGEEGVSQAKEYAKGLKAKWGALDAIVFSDDLNGDLVPLASGLQPQTPTRDRSTSHKPRVAHQKAIAASYYWDMSFGRHCKAVYYALQATLPLLHEGTHPRIIQITPPPLCEPDMFKADVPEATAKHIQGMYVIGHAVEFAGAIQSNGLWPGRGGGKLPPSEALKLLACTDYAATGNFYSALEGGHVEATPKPASPYGSHVGYPMTRFAANETWITDAATAWLNERAEM